MKVEELRIGNFIKYRDIIGKVNKIFSPKKDFDAPGGICYYSTSSHCGGVVWEEHIEPIELTEELLVKIGFEKDGNNYSLVCGDIEVGYYVDKFKQALHIKVPREKRFYKNELRSYDVKYLHQLQNTYYCLTNKELEIEL